MPHASFWGATRIRLVCSTPYNLVLGVCAIIVLSISQTGVSAVRPLLALGAVLVYWQAAELGTLRSRCSLLVNLQCALSLLLIGRFPAGEEISDAIARNSVMGVMGVLASMSFPFILSQYVINISSPRFLYDQRRDSAEHLFVGSSRLAGLKLAIFTLLPFFFFGTMVNGAFVSRFASARTFQIQYWGHLIFGDSLLFLCQLLAVFFLFRFTSLVITTVSALVMSFLMGSRSGTVALLLFLVVLFSLRLLGGKRHLVARLKRRPRGNRVLRVGFSIVLLLVLLGGASVLLGTTDWTDARSVRSIVARKVEDDSLRERVELVGCHSARIFTYPDEAVFGAYYNAGNCSSYLHSALGVFQVLGVLFSLPTLILMLMIFERSARAPAFSLQVLLLLSPSLILSVVARFGFGFFLPTLVLFLRAQEVHLGTSRGGAFSLYPSIFLSAARRPSAP